MAKDDLWKRAKARIDKLSAEAEGRANDRLSCALATLRSVPIVQPPQPQLVLTVLKKPGGGYLIRLP